MNAANKALRVAWHGRPGMQGGVVRMLRVWALVLLCLAWLGGAAQAAGAPSAADPFPVQADAPMEGIPLGRRLSLAFDEPGQADAAARRARADGFQVWGRDDINLGISRRTTWLRLPVANPGPQPVGWVLDIGDALIETVTLHEPLADGTWRTRTIGTRHPWAQRDVPVGRLVFRLVEPAASSRTLLLQVESGFGQRLALRAWDPGSFVRGVKEQNLYDGLYLGLLVSLAAFHLMLWGLLRQRAYLAYTALLFSVAVSQALFLSIGADRLWPEGSAALGLWVVLGFNLMHVCALWFARTGLRLATLAPGMVRLSHGLTGVAVAVMAASPWMDQAARSVTANALALVVQGSVLLMALRVGARGDLPARWFAAGWLCLIAGGLLWSLRNLGLVPDNSWTSAAGPAGMMMNALLLAGALAARVRQGETERLQAQGALMSMQRLANDALERRVRERTAELQASRDQADAANRMKDLFVRLVSHDLRSPLASIVAATDRAEAGPQTVAGIRGSAQGLIRLIDELLDLDRLRSGRMPLQRVRFAAAPWVAARIARLQALADGRGIRLSHTVPDSLWLFGSPALLGEVLTNLLSNALKVCGAGDRVVVAVDEDGRSLCVRDSGPGFGGPRDGSEAPRFADNPHERRRKPRPLGGRHGHGLRYGREIMAAHGGDLEVQDSQAGATVVMRLPPGGLRVLVVDGEASQHAPWVAALQRAWPDCDCTAFSEGGQALEQLAAKTCDLVVAAWETPDLPGLALLARLRSDPRWDTLPLLLTSAVASPEEALERERTAVRAGADGFLAKPVDSDTLQRTLQALFTYDAD